MTATSTGMTRLESFPFTSHDDGYDAAGYPVYDRAVDSRVLRATFAKFFTNGVFPSPGTALQIGKAATGLAVTVQPGICIINGAMGGVEGDDPITLTLDTAAPQGNVCYAVMLRYDNTDSFADSRSILLNVVRGDAGESPTPPVPDTSTPEVRELRLGYVTVPSGATDLSAATVHNEKGLEVCPYAAPFEEIDMSGVTADAKASAQAALTALNDFIETNKSFVESAIDGTTAGNLQNQITALQEQLSNIDFSTMVDNETIGYTQEVGDPNKLLRLIGIPSGMVGKNQISESVFTDDTSSNASASDKVAATPKFVHSVIDGIPPGLSAVSSKKSQNVSYNQKINFSSWVQSGGFSVGDLITPTSTGLVFSMPCLLLISYTVTFFGAAPVSFLINGDRASPATIEADGSDGEYVLYMAIDKDDELSITNLANNSGTYFYFTKLQMQGA